MKTSQMKFSALAQIYDKISNAKSDPERVQLLAELFTSVDKQMLVAIAHFTFGELIKPEMSENLGIGPGTIRAALIAISGADAETIDLAIKQTGDLSDVVSHYSKGRDRLTVDELWQRANRMVTEDEDRLTFLETVFQDTTPTGAKYFTRMALNQMRIGVGLGTLARALAKAFDVKAACIEHLYAMSNDIGLAAAQAQKGQKVLDRTGLTLFRPYHFMNAHKIDSAIEIFQRLKGKQILFEVKYDGARLQIHLRRSRPPEIKLYSRRLNDDTESMPDVVAALQQAWTGGDAIMEGEVVAFDKTLKKKQPFQAVLNRLGRKYEIAEKVKEIPLVLYLFDLLYYEGEDLMNVPQLERRQRLQNLFRPTERVQLTEMMLSDRLADEEKFFRKALKEGHEGLMAKDPEAHYQPGKRTENWMKLKPAFETLDVVVVGGIWGSGRRRGLLSSLIVAIRDDEELKTVGKVGTGFSEETLRQLTVELESKIITSRGLNVEIEPDMVIEVDFQDIQKTDRYPAGYVLRIPRFKQQRTDKSIREADNLTRLKRLYKQMH